MNTRTLLLLATDQAFVADTVSVQRAETARIRRWLSDWYG